MNSTVCSSPTAATISDLNGTKMFENDTKISESKQKNSVVINSENGTSSTMENSSQPVSRSPSIASIKNFQWSGLLLPRSISIKSKKMKFKVEGEWLCLKELQDVEFNMQDTLTTSQILRDVPVHPLGRDPVSIERSNLVNISKLVVKELIEQSLRYGRMLDSDHLPLQHFFIVLEHVLRHGLRPRKGLLGHSGAQELWDLLQTVEKYAPEAQDITASVRDLPTVRTHMGRARAWLRLALMQKKLADYLKVLMDNRDEVLYEYFEGDALMMSDEAIVIIGLLVGLNVIDCNLCVKEEDLDCPQGVIDFSLYLRSSSTLADPESTGQTVENPNESNMSTVLDQKNYIEELNRHLNATVTNLHAKVESLTTMNALLKEDMSIASTSILTLNDENRQLRLELGRDVETTSQTSSGSTTSNSTSNTGQSIKKRFLIVKKPPKSHSDSTESIENIDDPSELKQRLIEERRLRSEADRELDLQTSIKAEMEMAMKLLEKDIHEKQDTIVSLRRQLDDIKAINLDMYKKLQECEPSLKHRTELVAKLEAKAQSMSEALQTIETKYHESENRRMEMELERHELSAQVTQNVELTNHVESDLKTERKWRLSLQSTNQEAQSQIHQLQAEMNHLRVIAKKYAALQEDYYALREKCLENDQTLEELGTQLSTSKLEIIDLKEAAAAEQQPPKVETNQWTSDSSVRKCQRCGKEFSLTRRRHHCRYCGGIFCGACSEHSAGLPSASKPVRVCETCHDILQGN